MEYAVETSVKKRVDKYVPKEFKPKPYKKAEFVPLGASNMDNLFTITEEAEVELARESTKHMREKIVDNIKGRVEYVRKEYEPKPFKPSEFDFQKFTSDVKIERKITLDPSLHPDRRFKPPT